MEEKSIAMSFLSLSGCDSGVTLVTTDSLVRKNEQQQKEISQKNEKIEDLEETVTDLRDVVQKYKNQLCDISKYESKTNTSWVRNLVAENEELKETLEQWSSESEKLIIENQRMKTMIKNQQRQIETLERQENEWLAEKEYLLLDMEQQEEAWETSFKEFEMQKEESEKRDGKRLADLRETRDRLCFLCKDLTLQNDTIIDSQDEENKSSWMNAINSTNDLITTISSLASSLHYNLRKLSAENEILNNEKKKMQELVEFMQLENEFTIEELKNVKQQKEILDKEEKAVEKQKSVLEEEKSALQNTQSALEKEISFLKCENSTLVQAKNVLESEKSCFKEERCCFKEERTALTTKNSDLKETLTNLAKEKDLLIDKNMKFEINCKEYRCRSARISKHFGKLIKRISILEEKLSTSMAYSDKIRRMAVKECKKKAVFEKKCNLLRRKQSVNCKKFAMEKRVRNALGSRNLSLKFQLQCLSSEIESFEAEKSSMKKVIQNATIENLKTSQLVEQNAELEGHVKMLKNVLSEKNKDLLCKKQSLKELEVDLAETRSSQTQLASKLREMESNREKLRSELEGEKQTSKKQESEITRLCKITQPIQRSNRNWFQKHFCGCSN